MRHMRLWVTSCSVFLVLVLLLTTVSAFGSVANVNPDATVSSADSTVGAPVKKTRVAAFSGMPTSGSKPLTVAFQDESTGEITSYTWNFGDGMTSSVRNPSHEYTTAGSYTVTLTVTGPGKADSETKPDYISVMDTPAKLTNGTTKIGIYKDGIWYLDWNGNGVFENGVDRVYSFGGPGWMHGEGDWNGDGRIDIGITNGQQWYLDWNGNGAWDGPDKAYSFGGPGCSAMIGDWNGDNASEVSVYQNGMWYLDSNGNGVFDTADRVSVFGLQGWLSVAGDWNGDGKTEIGVYKDGSWYLDDNGNGIWDSGDKEYQFPAQVSTKPVIGDWNGDGRTKAGYYRWGYWSLDYHGTGIYSHYYTPFFGQQFDYVSIPVVGDWDGDGETEIGLYQPANGAWYLDYNGNGVWDSGSDKEYTFGAVGWEPVVGIWS